MASFAWWRRAEPPSAESVPDAFADQARLLRAAGIDAQVIVDGGAYVGELTARYVEKFPRAHVWAVEPAPANVDRLKVRFREASRVTIVPAALAEADGEQILALNDADMTHSLLPLDPTPYPDYPVTSIGEVPVPTVSLDSFCRKHGIERVSILKLDVQGAEAAVLAGASGLLAEARIDILFTELCFVTMYMRQTTTWSLLEDLGRYGYRLFGVYNSRRAPSGQLKWGDAIFPSPRVRERAGI